MALPPSHNERRVFHARHTVLVRAAWGPADTWEVDAALECLWFEHASAPEVGRAEFLWRFGLGFPPGGRPGEIHLPKSYVGMYVMVEVAVEPPGETTATTLRWYGVIRHDARNHAGDVERPDLPNTRIASGDQVYTAFGLESLLAQQIIRSAIVLDPSVDKDTPPRDRKLQRIGRGLTFNVGTRRSLACAPDQVRGNRSALAGPHARYVFGATLGPGDNDEVWRVDEIVDHLLEYHATRSGEGVDDEPRPAFFVDYAWGAASALVVEAGEVPTHGRTVWDVLTELIDRRRLLSFRCDVEDGGEGEPQQILLRVFSLTETELELPDGVKLPANPPRDYDFGRSVFVREAATMYDETATYDRVVVVGAQRTAVFTCSGSPDSGETDGLVGIVKGWTDADEATYEAGATEAADYDGLSEEEQAERDALLREEDRLKAVYKRFLLDPEFRGVTGLEATPRGVCPPVTIEPGEKPEDPPTLKPDIEKSEPCWRPGLRLLRQLPLLERHDYSGDKIEKKTVEDKGPAEALRPIVWLRTTAPREAEDESDDGVRARYSHVDRLSAASSDGVGIAWEAGVRVLDDDLGLEIDVRSAPQWQLAGSDFSSAVPGETPQADWKNLVATVCCEWDAPLKMAWPLAAERGERDRLRELWIEIPDARLDYVVPGTWVATEDGRPVKSDGGFLVRPKGTPDWLRCLRIARLAYAWYSRPRRAFRLSFRRIDPTVKVGEMVGRIRVGADQLDVATVVTSLRYVLADGETASTSLSTSFAELDGRGFF